MLRSDFVTVKTIYYYIIKIKTKIVRKQKAAIEPTLKCIEIRIDQ